MLTLYKLYGKLYIYLHSSARTPPPAPLRVCVRASSANENAIINTYYNNLNTQAVNKPRVRAGRGRGTVCVPLFYYSIIGTRIQHLHKIYITIRSGSGLARLELAANCGKCTFSFHLIGFCCCCLGLVAKVIFPGAAFPARRRLWKLLVKLQPELL